jgi:hypothetical protein
MNSHTHYINVRVAPHGKPANTAFRVGHNVAAPTWDDALQMLSDSLQRRGLRIVSIVRTEGGV